jgi:hypothetical protein
VNNILNAALRATIRAAPTLVHQRIKKLTFLGDTMRFLTALFTMASLICGGATIASATPNCRPCPYSCNDLGLGKKDCSFLNEARGVCCLDLSQKGIEVANAQAQVLAQQNTQRPQYNAQNGLDQQSCPPGFRPSEQKCSPEERRRGCKDMRLPSGLGCVKR